jgi:hypothetical protein
MSGAFDYSSLGLPAITPGALSFGFGPGGMNTAGVNAAAGTAIRANPTNTMAAPAGGPAGVLGSGSLTDMFKGSGLGMNLGTAQLALGGLQTIAGIWGAWQANKLAKDQLNFQKGVVNTNLANQVQSYNTTLEDRARSRAHTQNQDPSTADDYIAKHSLRRTQI